MINKYLISKQLTDFLPEPLQGMSMDCFPVLMFRKYNKWCKSMQFCIDANARWSFATSWQITVIL